MLKEKKSRSSQSRLKEKKSRFYFAIEENSVIVISDGEEQENKWVDPDREVNLIVSSIKRLSELAKKGREVLMNGDVDELGRIIMEAWRLHQELDPHCNNKFVDKLFEFSDRFCCGYKLVGAGGGGFALLLAKDGNSAKELEHLLEKSLDFDVKVYKWNIFAEK